MPAMKTNRSAAKRFKVSGNGKLIRFKANKRHILAKKSTKRKRDMRSLWITRINAAARLNGISYSRLMHGLSLAGVNINRKMLAEMAVNDAEGFAALAKLADEKNPKPAKAN